MGEEEKVVYLQGLIYRWQYIFSIGIVLDEKGANQVITRFAPFLHPKFKVISIFCGGGCCPKEYLGRFIYITKKGADFSTP